MNKREVIEKVSVKSGLEMEDCNKVLEAFEDVITTELYQSKNAAGAFDKIFDLLSFIKRKR